MWPLCVPAWGAAVAAGALILYGTLDVAYFARMMYTVARARYFRKKACLLETTEVVSWVLLSDVDTLLYHMNNARYLRELDFARADFYERTGLYSNIRAAGGAVVQAAATIRYRRYLKPFTKFTITSRVIYWDNKTVFMEHEFVGPGGFVHAVAVCRQRVIDTAAAPIAELLVQLHCAGTCKPQLGKMPPELELWVQSNEISSARLRSTVAPAPFVQNSPEIEISGLFVRTPALVKILSPSCIDLFDEPVDLYMNEQDVPFHTTLKSCEHRHICVMESSGESVNAE